MALTQVTGARATFWLTQRPGPTAGTAVYTCLVSDLAANDFVCGMRAVVTVTGTTVSGKRTLTFERLGHTWTQTAVATAGVMIIR